MMLNRTEPFQKRQPLLNSSCPHELLADAQPRVRADAPGRAFFFAGVGGGAPLNLVLWGVMRSNPDDWPVKSLSIGTPGSRSEAARFPHE